MDIQRSILLVALAIVSYLMVLQWNEDYGQAAIPASASATVGGNAAASLPDVPATNAGAADDVPTANAEANPQLSAPAAVSDQLIRVKTGDAFDVVGERVRTSFNSSSRQDYAEEDFEIKVRNRKAEPITVRVVEHLYRWSNWTIKQKSDEFTKKDAQTIEFNVRVAPDQEKVITYRVRYDWR